MDSRQLCCLLLHSSALLRNHGDRVDLSSVVSGKLLSRLLDGVTMFRVAHARLEEAVELGRRDSVTLARVLQADRWLSRCL